MSAVLLDTDVFSFLLKGDSRASAYTRMLQGERLALSFMTVAELFQWAGVRKWGLRRIEHLEQALAAYIVVPPDIEMCRLWGHVRAERQSLGHPISPQDAWIAATALRHNLPLITHNSGDFERIANLTVHTARLP